MKTAKVNGEAGIPVRSAIKPGIRVVIVLKQDQRSGRLTEGVVRDILTRSATHPHGIKVRLESGEVGRVQEIMEGQRSRRAAPDDDKA
ncbi:MAG: YwbE family protein [Desulfurivibrio sp.]|nr:MAG: YwbE family protein [Desulfurivibrio sp.]